MELTGLPTKELSGMYIHTGLPLLSDLGVQEVWQGHKERDARKFAVWKGKNGETVCKVYMP